MKRSLVVMTLLATLAVAAPAAAQDRRLFVNGDSLAVGTQPYFQGALPGWSIRTSASISRHTIEGPGVLRSLGDALPRVIAVSLGTNDDPRHTAGFRNAIRQTMAVAGPSRCVVWATVNRPPVAGTPYTAYNTLLREEARQRPNLLVVHWRRLVRANPQWLASDGVHVDAGGYRARGQAYARQIRKCP